MPCCSWWGFSSRTGFGCIFPARKKVTVVYCHLWSVRKLVSACPGEMRHRWFGLFALLQEMWLTCGSLVLALSPASSCEGRGCDGVCAKSHCKSCHKGRAQDSTEDWGEAGQRVQPFVLGSFCPHTRTRNYLSHASQCGHLEGVKPRSGGHPCTTICTTHYGGGVRSLVTQLQLTGALKLDEELRNTLPLSSLKCLLSCKMCPT